MTIGTVWPTFKATCKSLLLAALLVPVMHTAVMAQEDHLKDLPGYVDFGPLADLFGEPQVQVSLGQGLLNFVIAASRAEDPDTARLLEKLQAVRINVFNLDQDQMRAADHIAEVASRLEDDLWERIVLVQEDDERVHIYARMNGEVMEGLTVMAAGSDQEAVFINIIGSLNPEDLSQVVDTFDVDVDFQ